MWRFLFIPKVFALLIRSWFVRRRLGKAPLKLPPVAATVPPDDRCIEQQVRLADGIIKRLTEKGGHYCFYRSVTLATLLRKQGIPLVVNMGARSVYARTRMKAHGWLTLNDKPFYEQPNAIDLYPVDMGFNRERSIRYWIGPDFDGEVLNDSRVTRTNTARQAG